MLLEYQRSSFRLLRMLSIRPIHLLHWPIVLSVLALIAILAIGASGSEPASAASSQQALQKKWNKLVPKLVKETNKQRYVQVKLKMNSVGEGIYMNGQFDKKSLAATLKTNAGGDVLTSWISRKQMITRSTLGACYTITPETKQTRAQRAAETRQKWTKQSLAVTTITKLSKDNLTGMIGADNVTITWDKKKFLIKSVKSGVDSTTWKFKKFKVKTPKKLTPLCAS